MNRKEKIKILEDIQSGKIKIKSLVPRSAALIYYPDGTFRSTDSTKRMNKEEMEVFKEGMEVVIYIPDNGRD